LLALGNDILGDDGAALAAARVLKEEMKADARIEIVESSEAGLALMELLEGYSGALIVDSVMTGGHPAGTILEFSADDFRKVVAPSPHYAGIPEVMEMAGRLGIAFPGALRILAVEVENPYEVREEMSEPVKKAIPELVRRAREILGSLRRDE